MRCPTAFTLLELLVASVLASILTVTLLLVLGSLGRDRMGIDVRADEVAMGRRLVQLVRNDLLAAATMRPQQEGVSLLGHGGLEAATLRPSQRVAAVAYRIVEAGGCRWLVRQQQNLSETGPGRPWSELICAGVRSLELKAVGPAQQGPEVMPAQVHLVVQWDRPGRPPLDEVILLRGPKQ